MISNEDAATIQKVYNSGDSRLAHRLLDILGSDGDKSRAVSGGNGQRPPLAMIVATAAIALLVLSPFLLSSPSGSTSSETSSEVTSSD